MRTEFTIRLLGESRFLFILLACFFAQPLAALYSQTCVLPPAGLVGWWRGEGDTENAITDETGTWVGNATVAPGRVGLAFSFDGSGDGIVLTNSEPFHLQTFTIECWIRRRDASMASFTPAAGLFFSFGSGGYGFGLLNEGNLFLSKVGVWDVRTPLSVVADINWHHVAVVSEVNSATFYVDGNSRGSLSYTGPFTFATPAVIGAQPGNFLNSFLGDVDELAVFERAITPSEILSIFNSGTAGKCLPTGVPYITLQPTNRTVNAGDGTIFSVAAGGVRPLTYQWQFNGTDLLGETNTVLLLAEVQAAQAGEYSVQVSNAFGSTNSLRGTLTVDSVLPCVNGPSGVVGRWRGEGNTKDEFSQGFGALVGNASFAAGRAGLCFSFDGDGDGIALTDSELFQLQTFTIECWIRRRDASTASFTPSAGLFFSFGGGGYGFGLLNEGSLFLSKMDVWDVRTPASVVTDMNWHHVAVVSEANSATFYVDGVARGSSPYMGPFTFATPAMIGARPGNIANSFLGDVDELTVYERAATPSEILSIFNSGTASKCPPARQPSISLQPTDRTVKAGEGTIFSVAAGGVRPLTYQWQFNGTDLLGETNTVLLLAEVQGAQAGEYSVQVSNAFGSTNSLHGTLIVDSALPCVNGPSGLVGWWRGEGNTKDEFAQAFGTWVGNATFAPGRLGLCFSFDGDGDAVALTNSESFQLQTFTIECWIRRRDASMASFTPSAGLFFSFGGGGYGFGLLNGGSLFLSKLDAWDVRTPVSVVTDMNWHHVAVVSETNSATFYVDGASQGSLSYMGPFTFATPAAIGGRPDNTANSFLGDVDELGVYNRALTASEIQALYSDVSTSRCPLPLRIVTRLQDDSSPAGADFTFFVQAFGVGNLSYQWFFNTTNAIAGATNSSFGLTHVQIAQSGQYSVTITDNTGSAVTSAAKLIVYNPPVILLQPTNQVAFVGEQAEFRVSATNGPLAYQWQRNGMDINGATTPALIIAQAQTGFAGIYTVRVSNPFASITSEPASLTVSVVRITSISIVSNGVVLTMHSQPNLSFAVEASTNLLTNSTNWEPLATLLTVPANWNFTDSTGLNSSTRFYRIHSVP